MAWRESNEPVPDAVLERLCRRYLRDRPVVVGEDGRMAQEPGFSACRADASQRRC
jgi:hypothetical protein